MHNRNFRRKRKRKWDWKYIWRNYGWKLSKSKENRYQDTGSTEGLKLVKPQQVHTKTYYNKNCTYKDKERILKVARETKCINYKGTPIRLSDDFSTEILQARREWQDIFKALKGKNMQPRILYPARISFKIEEEIKNFSNKQKLRVQQY